MTLRALAVLLFFPLLLRGADVTVVCFGDSITEGKTPASLKKEERWVDLLQQRTGAGVSFVNEGKGGRPASALNEFREMLQRHAKIDVLVISLGTNDSRDTAVNASEKFAKNLATMVDEARKKNRNMLIVFCAPYNISVASLKKNQELGPVREKNLVAFGAAVKAVSEKDRNPFVDLYGVLPEESLASDGVHPDKTGHAKIADAIWPTLQMVLNAPRFVNPKQ
jgi:acyl-CoA thioesterase I